MKQSISVDFISHKCHPLLAVVEDGSRGLCRSILYGGDLHRVCRVEKTCDDSDWKGFSKNVFLAHLHNFRNIILEINAAVQNYCRELGRGATRTSRRAAKRKELSGANWVKPYSSTHAMHLL